LEHSRIYCDLASDMISFFCHRAVSSMRRKPFIMDQLMEMMVIYASNLEVLVNERTQLLYEEKLKTEDLLHRMLPKSVWFLSFLL
jgi:hypothetical protein